MHPLTSLINIFMTTFTLTTRSVSATQHLNVTTTAASAGKSVLQCWQFAAPIITSTQPGTQGSMVAQLGDLSNASYSIIPAGTNGGAHNAPYPQYVALLAGAAIITIPNSTQKVHVRAGRNGLLFAADTAALSLDGHVSVFTEEAVLLQMPTAGGVVPPHTILYEGGCEGAELVK